MENKLVQIKSIEKVTHDVMKITTDRPADYDFIPGQATEVSINKEGWREEKHPFTFTNLQGASELEFTIKTYPEKGGLTKEIAQLKVGDELILHKVFGTIHYSGEGLFIAGGAGVTPFISIFRELKARNAISRNTLVFANKTREDIINESEFRNMLGDSFISILSEEELNGHLYGRITPELLKSLSKGFKEFYLCGPPEMVEKIAMMLKNQGVTKKAIIREKM